MLNAGSKLRSTTIRGAAFGLLLSIAATASASAGGELSGGVWATNNYLDRGLSLSNDKPAAQAELAYTLDSGLYGALFTSSVHDGESYGQEFQFKAGIARETAGVSWDLFLNQHTYTGVYEEEEANFWEVELDVSRPVGPLTPVVAFVGAPDGRGKWGGYGFIGAESGLDLPHGFALEGGFGRMMFSDGEGDDYTFYSSGLSWTHGKTGLEFYVGAETAGLDGEPRSVFRLGRSL